MAVTLRNVTMEDAAYLYEWRNDPRVRENCFDTRPFSFESHIQWLESILADTKRYLFLGIDDGVPVGSIRADFGENECELTWAIAPSQWGKGYGNELVRLLVLTLECPLCVSRTKPANIASERICVAAGFQEISRTERETLWHLRR
jgi:RimJ/RimL family protein N-acetyltransferase